MAVVIKVGETEAVSVGIGEKVYIQGDPGFSPTIEVTDITGGHRLTITDINGDKTVDVMNGAKGDTGATGNGIEYITLNADYTLTVHYTNGTSWTSESIRGEKGDKGDTGTSISGAVLNADYTLTLTFSDGSSYTTPSIRGAQGQPGQTGATPDISIGTVETLPPGSPATATITGTAENPVLSFGIPQGQQGAPGEVTQAEFDALADDVAQNTENIDDLDGELTRQKSAIEDLEALTNRKAGMLVDTASGAIASFVPDSTVDNLLGVSVAVEPVQDLHGYDAPWPAGGSAQLLPTFTEDMTQNGITLKVNDDRSVTLNGTATATTVFGAPTSSWQWDGVEDCWLSGCPAGGNFQNSYSLRVGAVDSSSNFSSADAGNGVKLSPINPSADLTDKDLRFEIVVRSGTVCTNLTFKPMLNKGLSAQPFQPYKNICPISGWDNVEVERTGVNLLDPNIEHSAGYINNEGGITQLSGYEHTDGYIRVNPSTGYCFSGGLADVSLRNSVAFYDKFYNFLSRYVPSTPNDAVFTTPSNCKYIRFNYSTNRGLNGKQLEEGSTATAYAAFQGQTLTIQLGQTVYGGTLTIAEDGSVAALVDRVKYSITGAETYNQFSRNQAIVLAARLPFAPKKPGQVISNLFKPVSSIANPPIGSVCVYTVNGNILFGVDTSVITNMSEWVAFATENNLHVVYELETPIAIQLDPVTISTIPGQTNNAWADAGDVRVEFAADLKTYIDQKIAAAVAALS